MKNLTFQDIPIVIEYEKGDVKKAENPEYPGQDFFLYADYGYIENTVSNEEGEALDVFLGEAQDSTKVYLMGLLKRDGSFDEIKTFLGFEGDREVRTLAEWQYGSERIGPIVMIGIEDFKETLRQQSDAAAKKAKEGVDDE